MPNKHRTFVLASGHYAQQPAYDHGILSGIIEDVRFVPTCHPPIIPDSYSSQFVLQKYPGKSILCVPPQALFVL